MKKSILLLVSIICCLGMYAGDIIVLTNSTRIDAKILEVSDTEIKYKKISNLEGPTFVLKTNQISSIVYENGEVTAFAVSAEPSKEEKAEQNSSAKQEKEVKESKETDKNSESIWKFNPQPSDNHKFGLTLGYASKTVKQKTVGYLPVEGSLMFGRVGHVSPSLFFGFTANPTFKYGIGFRSGFFMEYAFEHDIIDPEYTQTGHDLTFSIPLQVSYRYELIPNLSIMLYTGPVFDFGAMLLVHYRNDESHYGGYLYEDTSDNLYGENGYTGFNALWGLGAGVQWKNLRLDLGGEWGMVNKLAEEKEATGNWNKPFYISLTWMF